MNLPTITRDDGANSDGTVLVVFAPFGTDETLSTYPDGSSLDLAQHPLYQALLVVAGHLTHICALIDLAQKDSFLVEIPAGHPEQVTVTSRWKQNMASPNALAGLLHHAHAAHPDAALVLALEGHGAGYLPDIDARKLTADYLTNSGKAFWLLQGEGSLPWKYDGAPPLPTGSPILPTGSPILPTGSPILPTGSPILPRNHMPMSTFGLGQALNLAQGMGVPRLAVIHFNNCFNMSVEVLHTVAPYADYATGYPNYNFFTAGAAYPHVFEQLRDEGRASSAEVATWFADGNQAVLAGKGFHPTVGCVVHLAAMAQIAEKIDDLADALLAALRNAPNRPQVLANIRSAIIDAQQYDTSQGDFELETPDELTDIRSLAFTLKSYDLGEFGVHAAADGVIAATHDIKRYGEHDHPWLKASAVWDFRGDLAMNIFLPDPLLKGLWDWRSPFYLDVNPDPTKPRVQPGIISFVQVTDWVDFIIEYHKTGLNDDPLPFLGLRAAAIPEFPVFNATFVPPDQQPKPAGQSSDYNDPQSPAAA